MKKFAIGTRVKIADNADLEANHQDGSVGTVTHHDYRRQGCLSYEYGVTINGSVGRYNEDELELAEEFEVGQIYACNQNNDEFKVLAVDEVLVASSRNNHFDEFDCLMTKAQFKSNLLDSGYWKLKTDETENGAGEESITEVTLDQIAEKFNVPVEELRIKKES